MLLSDLHDWHKPVVDPETGQPRFMWYGDSKELRESMDELRTSIGRMNESLNGVVDEMRKRDKAG